MQGFNPSIEGQPLQPVNPTASPTVTKSFNPSIEGQPLQQPAQPTDWDKLLMFQSLYRGTAFATPQLLLVLHSFVSFNPSTEGQPLQLTEMKDEGIEFPKCFNPSTEGQPLQRESTVPGNTPQEKAFQSLYRGTAFATLKDAFAIGTTSISFNPSTEGQPLQQSRCRSLDFQWLQQAVFLTYG